MSEWKKVKLGEVCEISAGGDRPQIFSNHRTDKCRIPIYSNGIDNEGLYGFTDTPKNNGNAITITGRGANAGTVFYRKDPFLSIIRLLTLTPNSEIINAKYLFYLLKNKTFLSTGSAQPQITVPNISQFEIEFNPDIETQHRIATILSRYDSLIENYQKQIKLLEEAAQRLYKEWFIDLHFPGHENTNIIDGVPEGWEKKKLHEIAEVVMGSSPKSEFYNNDKQGLPFHQGVGSYGTRFVDDNVYSTSITRLAEPNSILFSVRAPVGRLNITKNKIIIGRGLAAMNHKDGFQSFLFYMLKERFFMDNIIGNGSIFASISKVELLDQEFIVPPMKTIKAFESLASKLDKKIQGVDTQLRLLTEARDRLLPRLMGGEITV